MTRSIAMINILITIAVVIGSAVSAFGILSVCNLLNIQKEYRFKQHSHVKFLICDIGIGATLYFGIWLVALITKKGISGYKFIPGLVLMVFLVYKVVYYITRYSGASNKSTNTIEDNLPIQYYEDKGNFYLSPYYSSVSKAFRYTGIFLTIILAAGMGVAYYIYQIRPDNIVRIVATFTLLPLLLNELASYFDGSIEDKKVDEVREKKIIRKQDATWKNMDEEYHKLWRKQLLGRYNITNEFERKVVDGRERSDLLSENIAKSIGADNTNDFLYSRILSPIMQGKDMIVESCLIQSFSDIMIPIINIMFTASKRIMFLCDSYSTVRQCEKWLELLDIKSNSSNANIVIDVLNYENDDTIKMDNNVDIYIGTVDLALNSKAIHKRIDTVFCINIDKIISENALNLNLIASVLSGDRYDDVQYILFGNRVNGLKQTASQVFMRNNFEYQVVNSSVKESVHADFWSTEKGWLQAEIMPGFAARYLGQLIPLSIPAFKFGIQRVDIIASGQSLSDQMLYLQTAQPALKKYLNRDIINIDEAIITTENENFLSLEDNSVVVVSDTSNNAALVLLNWMKYAKSNMFLHIVSAPYMLRDYIVANIDFFVGNVEAIGNILPIPKSNIKLSVYRLINQLCYGNVAEEFLLREINHQEPDVKIDTFENDQVRFVTEALQNLTRRAFGTNIFFASYLTSQKVNKEKTMESKRYYKLIESIKNELPERLFKNITFIDSEQSAKVLKKIPVFELYQNYLEGQYVSFNGKCYLIDKIDYDNGIVELIYSNNNDGIRYRQCRQLCNVVHKGISKSLPVLEVRNSILKKHIIRADIDVITTGYYEFNNIISFVPGGFAYKEVDDKKKGLRRNYKSTNILVINIFGKYIVEMSEKDRFKLSFTLSVLLNEVFETLFSDIKQYILARSVVRDESFINEYKDNQLIRLYSPIIDGCADEGINIYITEDTELEKGITDTIANNFDNIIMRLLFDYLYWLLKEDEYIVADNNGEEGKWVSSANGDFISVEKIDKRLFLKYGKKEIDDILDLEAAYDCLCNLILNGNDQLTKSRFEFIKKRRKNNPYKMSESRSNTVLNNKKSTKQEKSNQEISNEENIEKNVQENVKKTEAKEESNDKNSAKPKESNKKDDSSSNGSSPRDDKETKIKEERQN